MSTMLENIIRPLWLLCLSNASKIIDISENAIPTPKIINIKFTGMVGVIWKKLELKNEP